LSFRRAAHVASRHIATARQVAVSAMIGETADMAPIAEIGRRVWGRLSPSA
jgi:hypothetical protein